ncbi:MAG TPA: hypothetical protein VJR27_05395 [Candidatus Saccharimonadales bacterium]|nr:hypothetical protein [Candidatus Saccharimonadales bacterium]
MAARKPAPVRMHADVQRYFDVLDRVQSRTAVTPAKVRQKIDIEQEIAREQKIKNDNAEQDIALKHLTLMLLFGFLAIETATIFVFTYWQAVQYHGFHLEDWSFKLLVTATILQITAMLFAAVRYLFPKSRR